MIRRIAEWCCPRGTIELAFLMDAYRDKLQWGAMVVWEKARRREEEGERVGKAWAEFEKVRRAHQERWMQDLEARGHDGL
jgi:hypothetical protein